MSKKQKEFTFDGKTYLIDSTIKRHPYGGEHSPWKRLYESMEIGDSVLLTRKEAVNFLSTINVWIVDGVPKTRKMSIRVKDGDHARIWKIK